MKLINYVKHQWVLRTTLQRFNIWTVKCDPSCKEPYWLGYDGKIYYGSRFGYLAESAQNSWYNELKEAGK